MADLLALLHVMFSCVFVTFPCGVLGQMWYFIVWIPYFLFKDFYYSFFKLFYVMSTFCELVCLFAFSLELCFTQRDFLPLGPFQPFVSASVNTNILLQEIQSLL